MGRITASQKVVPTDRLESANFAVSYLKSSSPLSQGGVTGGEWQANRSSLSTGVGKSSVVSGPRKSSDDRNSEDELKELDEIRQENRAILKEYIALNPVTLVFNNQKVERDYQSFYEEKRRFVFMGTLASLIVLNQLMAIREYRRIDSSQSIQDPLFFTIVEANTAIACFLYLIASYELYMRWLTRKAERAAAMTSAAHSKKGPNSDVEQGLSLNPAMPAEVRPHPIIALIGQSLKCIRNPLPSDNLILVWIILSSGLSNLTGKAHKEAPEQAFCDNSLITVNMLYSTVVLSRMPYVYSFFLGFVFLIASLYAQDWKGDSPTSLSLIHNLVIFTYSLRISELAMRRDFRLTRRLAAENIDVKADITTRNWFNFGKAHAADNGDAAMRVAPSQNFIKEEDLKLGCVLGSGGFGEVVQGEWRGTQVAVKKIHGTPDKKSVVSFGTESAIMEGLRHPNIVMYLGTCISPVLMVMELMPHGSLYQLLNKKKVALDWSLKLRMLLDAARGMNFLHAQDPPVLHNDLKSLNLLVDENWRCKVSDFGFSELRTKMKSSEGPGTSDSADEKDAGSSASVVATIGWASPEAIQEDELTLQSDVYSFGVVLFEMLFKEVPFNDLSREAIALAIIEGKRPRDYARKNLEDILNEIINPAKQSALRRLSDLMDDCLATDPTRRPSFDNLVHHLDSIFSAYCTSNGRKTTVIFPRSNSMTAAEELLTDLDSSQEFSIDPKDLTMGPKIGSGGYGQVFEAIYHGTHVAVKQLHNSSISQDALKEFNKECRLMLKMRHPNVVLFMGSWTRPPKLLIVTELCSRGSLYFVYKKNPKPELKEHNKIIMKVAEGTALGLNYLHCNNPAVIHRDLKSPNILLDDNWNAKVADFGLSRIREEGKIMTSVGSPLWAAPEVLRGEESGFPSDVYSYGILIWETLAWQEPYPGDSPAKVMRGVAYQKMRPQIPKETPPLMKKLLEDCWLDEPSSRPNFDAIIARLKDIEEELPLL